MTLSKHHKKSLIGIKSLAMMKMEKNFSSLEKGYPRKPYNDKKQTLDFLMGRLEDELEELQEGINDNNLENIMEECAELSNIIDYIYEKVLVLHLKQGLL